MTNSDDYLSRRGYPYRMYSNRVLRQIGTTRAATPVDDEERSLLENMRLVAKHLKDVGLTHRTLETSAARLVENSKPNNPNRVDREMKKKMLDLRKDGFKLTEIAERFGVTPTTVSYHTADDFYKWWTTTP